jgi:hypothetical protein
MHPRGLETLSGGLTAVYAVPRALSQHLAHREAPQKPGGVQPGIRGQRAPPGRESVGRHVERHEEQGGEDQPRPFAAQASRRGGLGARGVHEHHRDVQQNEVMLFTERQRQHRQAQARRDAQGRWRAAGRDGRHHEGARDERRRREARERHALRQRRRIPLRVRDAQVPREAQRRLIGGHGKARPLHERPHVPRVLAPRAGAGPKRQAGGSRTDGYEGRGNGAPASRRQQEEEQGKAARLDEQREPQEGARQAVPPAREAHARCGERAQQHEVGLPGPEVREDRRAREHQGHQPHSDGAAAASTFARERPSGPQEGGQRHGEPNASRAARVEPGDREREDGHRRRIGPEDLAHRRPADLPHIPPEPLVVVNPRTKLARREQPSGRVIGDESVRRPRHRHAQHVAGEHDRADEPHHPDETRVPGRRASPEFSLAHGVLSFRAAAQDTGMI